MKTELNMDSGLPIDLITIVNDLKNLKDDRILIEDRFRILLHQHEHIVNMLDDIFDIKMNQLSMKMPHRCPVCNGSRFEESGILCNPCDGKGIVWG